PLPVSYAVSSNRGAAKNTPRGKSRAPREQQSARFRPSRLERHSAASRDSHCQKQMSRYKQDFAILPHGHFRDTNNTPDRIQAPARAPSFRPSPATAAASDAAKPAPIPEAAD